jgi:hypothetical protein
VFVKKRWWSRPQNEVRNPLMLMNFFETSYLM